MKNIRFEILDRYFEKKVGKSDLMSKESLEIFEKLNKVLDKNNISLDVNDAIFNTIAEYYCFILDVLSNCPFLKLEISNLNDIVVKLD